MFLFHSIVYFAEFNISSLKTFFWLLKLAKKAIKFKLMQNPQSSHFIGFNFVFRKKRIYFLKFKIKCEFKIVQNKVTNLK